MNNLKSLRQTIEKGCGKLIKKYVFHTELVKSCGDERISHKAFCPECKAKLQLLDEVEKIIRETIETWSNKYWRMTISPERINELKSSLGISDNEEGAKA